MAFNPFRAFRKHQKTLFAGLTIVCMVTFVLSSSLSGGGDFFGEVTRILSGRARENSVASLYGREIDRKEVTEIQRQRRLANGFMSEAVQGAFFNVFSKEFKVKQDLQQYPDLQQQLQQLDQRIPPYSPQYLSYLERMHQDLEASKKTAQAESIQQLIALHQEMSRIPIRQGSKFYFGGSDRLDDVLDFLIWRHQADKLGIQLSPEDVGHLVDIATQKERTADLSLRIEQGLQRKYGKFSPETLLRALTDEFRVQLAQLTLMGYDPNQRNKPPEAVTPLGSWEYFQKNRTEGLIALLPIPVNNADFLKQVGQPSEEDLRKLFDQSKGQEFNPALASAGFKQPERIQVEWVSARPDSPHYKEEAAKAGKITQAAFQLAGGLSLGEAGPAYLLFAVNAAVPFGFDISLLAKYEYYKYAFRSPSWTEEGNLVLHESSLKGPRTLTAFVRQSLALGATGGPVGLGMVSSHFASAAAIENLDRIRIGASLVLSRFTGNPLAALGLTYYFSPRSEYLPLEEVRSQMMERSQEEIARQLVRQDLAKLRELLEGYNHLKNAEDLRLHRRISSPTTVAQTVGLAVSGFSLGMPAQGWVSPANFAPAPGEIKDIGRDAGQLFLAASAESIWTMAGLVFDQKSMPVEVVKPQLEKMVQTLGLTHGESVRPRDKFDIIDDPGLEPLKKAHMGRADSFSLDAKSKQYPSLFFNQDGLFTPQQLTTNEDYFVYWKTSERPAYEPNLDEVRDRVVARWKFEKARALAKAEADQMAAEARKAKGDASRNLIDGSKHSGKVFYLDHVSPLQAPKPVATLSPTAGSQYEPYQIPDDKVEHPSREMVSKLLDMKEPGAVEVLNDGPEANYYVAALVARTPPGEESFFKAFASAQDRTQLLGHQEQDSRFQDSFRLACMEKLREEARVAIDIKSKDLVDPKGSDEE